MKYRKKPIEIEAVQPLQTCMNNWPDWLWSAYIAGTFGVKDEMGACDEFAVETLEGDMTGTPSCWLIRGVEGELYPCKDSIFRATYEPVA